jgi:tetratricopeptide (TPR) repeat protein
MLLLAATTALLWVRRKRWGVGPLVAWAYFIVSLLPVLGFVHMSFMSRTSSSLADHLQYAAMPGILALAAALLTRAAGGRAGRAALVIVGIGVAAMGALTFQRAGVFISSQRLWQDNVEKNPRSAVAWYCLGTEHLQARALPEAIHCLSEAIELDPRYVAAYDNRGVSYCYAGRYKEAVGDFEKAIVLNHDDADAYCNRVFADVKLQDYSRALSDANAAQRLGAHSPPGLIRELAAMTGCVSSADSQSP